MRQSVNRRQSLEVFLTVVMSVAILLNINSIANGVGQSTSQLNIGERAESLIDGLADAGNSVQNVTETGVVQTVVGSVTGTQPAQTQSGQGGNIGDWISQSGDYVLDLFTPTERIAPAQFATAMSGMMRDLPDSVVDANGEFTHLSRPLVSNMSVEETIIEQLKAMHADLAVMIVLW